MCASEAGGKPALSSRAISARLAALAAVLALAGCASTGNPYQANNGPATRVAQAADVEDDGLPAQTPPPLSSRQTPDDPSEPFSRNYGGSNPSRAPVVDRQDPKPLHLPHPALPGDLPPAFRKQLAAALAQDE